MSFTGVIRRDASGTLWFDDHPVRTPTDVPRRKSMNGTLWYAPSGIASRDWAHLLSDGDCAFGPKPGQILGLHFGVGRGKMQVWSAEAWGVHERDPSKCFDALTSIRAQAASVGLSLKKSVAATAVQLYLDRFDGRDDRPALRQLPCRWRGISHAAMHGGPLAVLRGGAPYAIQLDVRQAYLDALYQDVPMLGADEDGTSVGGYSTFEKGEWKKIREFTGFVDATVRVTGRADDPTGLPPMPVHLSFGAAFPLGTFRGCWVIANVREAEERGEVEVLEVHQFTFAPQTRPLFAELANLFSTFPQPLQKRCYTRFWGKLGSRGGYVGVPSDEPREGEVPAGGLWWSYDGIALDSKRAARTYRPDLAAFVTAHNHRRMFQTIARLKPGSLVSCHVDAVWTTDVVSATKLCAESPDGTIGGWRQKRAGPIRAYGIGCYEHDGHLAASGYDSSIYGKLNRENFDRWQQEGRETHRRLVLETREWTGDPARDADATSRPLLLETDTGRSPAEGPSVYDPLWTSGGWARRNTTPPGEPTISL